MKVSDDVQGVLQAAYLHAKELGHEYLTPEHILHAATHFEVARQILASCGADPEEMKKELDFWGGDIAFLEADREDFAALFRIVMRKKTVRGPLFRG